MPLYLLPYHIAFIQPPEDSQQAESKFVQAISVSSMLSWQVFFHTKVLPKILWKSYPEVPDLPEFLREEQLMSVMSEKQLSERAALSPAASGLGSESSTQ